MFCFSLMERMMGVGLFVGFFLLCLFEQGGNVI